MGLEQYRSDMEMCCRCSICKFVPMERISQNQHSYVCPSVARFNFNAYSGGGRMAIGISLLEKRIDYSDKLLDVMYNCQMCGACDVSCKYAMDMEVLEPLNELRIQCVEKGRTLPALDKAVAGLRKLGTLSGRARGKGVDWSKGLKAKDAGEKKVHVLYHAGCRVTADRSQAKVARDTVEMLQMAGLDVGIYAGEERCCGGRAYEMGYKNDFMRQAGWMAEQIQKSGAETLVTGCAECYSTFKVLYDRFGFKGRIEVLHATELLERLIEDGKLKPQRAVAARVTYHDPCHLGRLGEPYIHWQGRAVPGQIRVFDPPKEFRRGSFGSYDAPRQVLRHIPGLELREMDRIKEYAWCCGAGGGVKESNPEFARWTARERIAEAETTGASLLATACPGCAENLKTAAEKSTSALQIVDVAELLKRSL
jgi:Fe-S oxidoreductase